MVIRASHLARALMFELEEHKNEGGIAREFEQLEISSSSFLERNVRSMMDCVDELSK